MNVYTTPGNQNYRFAIMSCHGPDQGCRKQRVISTCTKNKRLAVEMNGEIVPKSRHADTPIDDGAALEIVVAVGGG